MRQLIGDKCKEKTTAAHESKQVKGHKVQKAGPHPEHRIKETNDGKQMMGDK